MSMDEGELQTHFELAIVPDIFHLYYFRGTPLRSEVVRYYEMRYPMPYLLDHSQMPFLWGLGLIPIHSLN